MRKVFSCIFIGLILATTQTPSFAEVLIFSVINSAPTKRPVFEIMTEVYRHMGIQIKIIELPAKRAILYANRGEYDGELFRAKGVDKNFPNLVMVETPCHYMEKHAYVRAENKFEVRGWESIPKHFTIGAFFGVKYQETEINKYNLKAEYVKGTVLNLKKLNSGRVDVVVSSKNHAERTIKEHNLKNIVRLEPSIQKLYSFHYLHKKNARLVPEVNEILIKLTKNNYIKTVLEKYELEQ